MSAGAHATILFDLDGTLIDSTEAIVRCFEETFEDAKKPLPPRSEIVAMIGHTLEDMFAHLGVCEEEIEHYVARYKSHYRLRSKAMTRFLPGAKEAIEEAARFARLGIVTTKTGLYSRMLLEHMGVMDAFEVLIGREDVHRPKPHPEPILKALHHMKITELDRVWMVGDTCLDMKSAQEVGVHGIGVLSGYGSLESLRKCTRFIRKSTLEAVEFIKHYKKSRS